MVVGRDEPSRIKRSRNSAAQADQLQLGTLFMLTALTRLTQLIPRTAATPLLRHHFSTTAAAMANKWTPSSTPYPTVRRDESFIEHFKSAANGQVAVADPYNWLSQPAGTNDEVARFVSEQGDYTREYLKANTDAPLFKEALTKNWDYARCESSSGPRAGDASS